MSALEERMAFAMKAIGLPEPVRELHFTWCCEHSKRDHVRPTLIYRETKCLPCGWEHEYRRGRNWRFDFAWPDRKVALEIDGGTRSGGRHVRPDGFERDAEKLNRAAVLGWTVVRVTAAMVKDGRALNEIEAALRIEGVESSEQGESA